MATLNFNIGVLGHVDSGKTSLAKALSTVASTACFDKNPQSKERGITLDLGFSSFTVESTPELKSKGFKFIQYTLVDCPGHASLIKTIIGGAQIIDMMMLVIDIQKGVQTQTAECLIIGEICCDKLLIVLNKLDLIDEAKRPSVIDKMSKRLLKTLETTKFANSQVVAVAACNTTQSVDSEKENLDQKLDKLSIESTGKTGMLNLNIDLLIETIKKMTVLPERKNENGPLLFSVDHCFTIKGQGTVLTGTVLNGHVKINDNVEIPILKTQKKVKSIQVFRKPVERAIQGDRCGICISNFDSKQFERGVVCSPNYLKTAFGVIIDLNRIKHFKGPIESGSKFHISIGHETRIGKIELFGELDDGLSNNTMTTASAVTTTSETFDFSKDYLHVTEINPVDKSKSDTDSSSLTNDDESNTKLATIKKFKRYYAIIDFNFETTTTTSADLASTVGVLCSINSLLIGSKLDTDIHLNQCRIAFSGHVLHQFTSRDYRADVPKGVQQQQAIATGSSPNSHIADLRVYKVKSKEGVVERRLDEMTLIGKSLFKKETNMDLFNGLKVSLSTGELGVIEGSFGQSGKFRLRIPGGLLQSTKDILDASGTKAKSKKQDQSTTSTTSESTATASVASQIKIYLNYKRYIYDDKKKIVQ